ncbi:MAG: 16S rRNA (uracil(1498)-N(3))-methyltransferase [Sphingomicrobium sp.]
MPATPAWPPRSLPRLHVDAPLAVGCSVELDSGQANYLGNVMRLRVGAELLLFDGASGEWLARVTDIGKRRMTLVVDRLTRPVEAVPDLWLAFAPVKRGPVEWLVEKATELGVARLLPVVTKRTVVERIKRERLTAIAIEAAEQCGRTLVPAIAEPVGLDAFLRERERGRTLYFADESGGEALGTAFAAGPAVILVGPEGGFAPEERDLIRGSPGVKAISLGPRILRAETAALAAVTGWMALAGDWR